MRKIFPHLLREERGDHPVVYLIRLAIKRAPGGPNDFNETRIFVKLVGGCPLLRGKDGEGVEREREEKRENNGRGCPSRQICCFFSPSSPAFPTSPTTESRGVFFLLFFSFLHPFTLITPARKRECEGAVHLSRSRFLVLFSRTLCCNCYLNGFPQLETKQWIMGQTYQNRRDKLR